MLSSLAGWVRVLAKAMCLEPCFLSRVGPATTLHTAEEPRHGPCVARVSLSISRPPPSSFHALDELFAS
jgi:hypothetical protein